MSMNWQFMSLFIFLFGCLSFFPSWFVGTLYTINIHNLSKNILMPLSSPSQCVLFVYGVWCNIHVFNFGIKLPTLCVMLCVFFVYHKDIFIIVLEFCFYLQVFNYNPHPPTHTFSYFFSIPIYPISCNTSCTYLFCLFICSVSLH